MNSFYEVVRKGSKSLHQVYLAENDGNVRVESWEEVAEMPGVKRGNIHLVLHGSECPPHIQNALFGNPGDPDEENPTLIPRFLTLPQIAEREGVDEEDLREEMEEAGLISRVRGTCCRYAVTEKGSAYVVMDDDDLLWRTSILDVIE
jgi:hypothetical protein